jgi:hypothetical protein
MLTEVISKLDRVVLELALKDAFYDMCFYEGEEVTDLVESYLQDVINKKNTEEQNIAFFELAMPYINSSIMVYGAGLYEGTPEMIAPADKNTIQQKMGGPKGPLMGTQMIDKNRTMVNKLHESEEAVWEEVTNMIFMEGLLENGIRKAKGKGKGKDKGKGKSIISSKKFGYNLHFKLPEDRSPNPPENR